MKRHIFSKRFFPVKQFYSLVSSRIGELIPTPAALLPLPFPQLFYLACNKALKRDKSGFKFACTRLNPGRNPIFAEADLFAQAQPGKLRCAAGDVKVPVLQQFYFEIAVGLSACKISI